MKDYKGSEQKLSSEFLDTEIALRLLNIWNIHTSDKIDKKYESV